MTKSKTKFVDIGEPDDERIYRLTFSCFPEDYAEIETEIQAYATIIKAEKEVIT